MQTSQLPWQSLSIFCLFSFLSILNFFLQFEATTSCFVSMDKKIFNKNPPGLSKKITHLLSSKFDLLIYNTNRGIFLELKLLLVFQTSTMWHENMKTWWGSEWFVKDFCRDCYWEEKQEGDSHFVLVFGIHLTNDVKEISLKDGKVSCIA